MISISLAIALRDAGVAWTPAPGDRFAITRAEMADETFVLSDMTVEIHHLPEGDLIGFNGTTEWALDSVEPEHAVWMPNESQLRELLGGTFVRLEKSADRWTVVVNVNDRQRDYDDRDAAQAYAKALLGIIAE